MLPGLRAYGPDRPTRGGSRLGFFPIFSKTSRSRRRRRYSKYRNLTATLAGRASSCMSGRRSLRPEAILTETGRLPLTISDRSPEREVERHVLDPLDHVIDVSGQRIGAAISNVEASTGFRLTVKQREAVFMASSAGVSILSGATGTGKTAVLRAIVDAEARSASGAGNPSLHLVALAGRADRRMALATKREAWALSRLMTAFEMGLTMEDGLIVFDEASMLDTPTVYRVLSRIGTNVRVLFVGDAGQLPPIGAGLPFQKLVSSGDVPRVSLDIILRQAETSGIPTVAANMRRGILPAFGAYDFNLSARAGVFFIPCRTEDTAATVRKVFRLMAGPPPRSGPRNRCTRAMFRS